MRSNLFTRRHLFRRRKTSAIIPGILAGQVGNLIYQLTLWRGLQRAAYSPARDSGARSSSRSLIAQPYRERACFVAHAAYAHESGRARADTEPACRGRSARTPRLGRNPRARAPGWPLRSADESWRRAPHDKIPWLRCACPGLRARAPSWRT